MSADAPTYAKVGGPPDDWDKLEVVDLETGARLECVVEVNTIKGWAIMHAHPIRVVDNEIVKERVEGRYQLRYRDADRG